MAKAPKKITPVSSITFEELEALDAEGGKPFVFSAKGVDILFRDPMEMTNADILVFAEAMEAAITPQEALRPLLDDEGYKALDSLGLTVRQLLTLVKVVGEHYEAIFGDLGE